jgi:hypothetical protein
LIPQNKKLKQQGDQSNFLLEVYWSFCFTLWIFQHRKVLFTREC